MPMTHEFSEVLEVILRRLADLPDNSSVVDDYVYHCLAFAGGFGPIPNYPKWSDLLGARCAQVQRDDKNPATKRCIASVTSFIHGIEYGGIVEEDVQDLRRVLATLETDLAASPPIEE